MSTYEMDREDLIGEINVGHRLIFEAIEFLEQGDIKAAQMVLKTWEQCDVGHPEVEEDRPIYECRVCQAPERKRMMAKWAEQDRKLGDGLELVESERVSTKEQDGRACQ